MAHFIIISRSNKCFENFNVNFGVFNVNLIPSKNLFEPFRPDLGIVWVHYFIEPSTKQREKLFFCLSTFKEKKLSLNQAENFCTFCFACHIFVDHNQFSTKIKMGPFRQAPQEEPAVGAPKLGQ